MAGPYTDEEIEAEYKRMMERVREMETRVFRREQEILKKHPNINLYGPPFKPPAKRISLTNEQWEMLQKRFWAWDRKRTRKDKGGKQQNRIEWKGSAYPNAVGQPIPIFKGSGRFLGQLIWVGQTEIDTYRRALGVFKDIYLNVDPRCYDYTGPVKNYQQIVDVFGYPWTQYPSSELLEWEERTRTVDGEEETFYVLWALKRGSDYRGGDPSFIQTNEYSVSFAVAFAENFFNEDISLLKLWAGDTLIYDGEAGYTDPFNFSFTFYDGHRNEVDPFICAYEDWENVPKFKRTVYLVFDEFNAMAMDNSVPVISATLGTGDAAAIRGWDVNASLYGSFFNDEDYFKAGDRARMFLPWSFGVIRPDELGEFTLDPTVEAYSCFRSNLREDVAPGPDEIFYIRIPISFTQVNNQGLVPPDIQSEITRTTFSASPGGTEVELDMPDPDQSFYPLWPDIPEWVWGLPNEDWTEASTDHVKQSFIYQPKSDSYPRSVILVSEDSSYDAGTAQALLSATGDVEDTPIFLTKAHDGIGYYVCFTSRGPTHVSAYGWKQTFNEFYPTDYPFGDFVDISEGVIDFGSLPSGYDFGGMALGPLSAGGGEVVFFLEGGNSVRTLSWTCADSGGWGWTLGVWKTFDGEEVTGVWYDASLDRIAVSFATNEIRVYDYTTEAQTGTVTMLGFKVACRHGRDDEQLRDSTRVWRGYRTRNKFCFLVDEATGLQFRLLNMETMDYKGFAIVGRERIDRWKCVYLHQPAGYAITIESSLPNRWNPLWVDTPQFDIYLHKASDAANDFTPYGVVELLTALCVKIGYAEEDLEFTGCDNLSVAGWTLQNTSSYRAVITEICDFYGILVVDTGETMKFVRIENDATFTLAATLAEEDLVAQSGGTLVYTYMTMPEDVPLSFEVSYPDADGDFVSNIALAQRGSGMYLPPGTRTKFRADSPVALTRDKAENYAIRNLYLSNAQRTRHTFRVGPAHINLEPGDIVAVPVDGDTRYVQLRSTQLNLDFTLDCEGFEFLRDD